MADTQPVTELDKRYSSDGATPTGWTEASRCLEEAQLYWLSTVRPDGRPHVTPLLTVWLDGALYFCTGPSERKARNLAQNAHCVLTTGSNSLDEGLDFVHAVFLGDDEDFIDLRASRYRYAQPICDPGYLDKLPPVALPVKGLWVADTSYYYPEDRGISESIGFGRKMAKQAVV